MKYEKPTVTTYSEEEMLAIIGPAITGSLGELDYYDEAGKQFVNKKGCNFQGYTANCITLFLYLQALYGIFYK